MLLLQRKGLKAPFALIALILLFGKKKPLLEEKGVSPPHDNKTEAFPIPNSLKKTITGNGVSKPRDRRRLASIERDIIGNALTIIYEAEKNVKISDAETNKLLQHFKTKLIRVDAKIVT